MPLAATVAITIVAICSWSTTVGSLIPILAERFGVDPTVLSAPLITTLVDATGLVIYFSIAKVILRLGFVVLEGGHHLGDGHDDLAAGEVELERLVGRDVDLEESAQGDGLSLWLPLLDGGRIRLAHGGHDTPVRPAKARV